MKLNKKSGLVDPARFIASPNCDERPVGTVVDAVIIHCISLPPGRYGGGHIEQLFCNSLDPADHEYFESVCKLTVSAHFLIDREGALTQFVPTHLRAWHAGESRLRGRERVNDFSVGIELEGTEDSSFTSPQYDALIQLTRALMVAYPEIRKDNLVGHSDVAPGRKTDPGACFDWDRYLRGL